MMVVLSMTNNEAELEAKSTETHGEAMALLEDLGEDTTDFQYFRRGQLNRDHVV